MYTVLPSDRYYDNHDSINVCMYVCGGCILCEQWAVIIISSDV